MLSTEYNNMACVVELGSVTLNQGTHYYIHQTGSSLSTSHSNQPGYHGNRHLSGSLLECLTFLCGCHSNVRGCYGNCETWHVKSVEGCQRNVYNFNTV